MLKLYYVFKDYFECWRRVNSERGKTRSAFERAFLEFIRRLLTPQTGNRAVSSAQAGLTTVFGCAVESRSIYKECDYLLRLAA